MRNAFILSTAAVALLAAPVSAQTNQPSTRDRIGNVLGTLLGLGNQDSNSIDGQWKAGRTALANQRVQFDARVDSDVQSRVLSQDTAMRLKADYAALVDIERGYANDRTFSTAERADLSTRYNALVQVLNDRAYPVSATPPSADVNLGRADFDRRVDAAVSSRKLTRTAGRTLKSDYSAVIALETNYLRDGILSEAETADLDARLDALDVRVGDVAYAAPVTPRARLDAIARALPNSGLATAVRAQLLVEHGDLMRLESAYTRTTPTAEEKDYLNRRLTELEARARITR